MKRVDYFIGLRPTGYYEETLFVDDDATEKEIEEQIKKAVEFSMWYDVKENVNTYNIVNGEGQYACGYNTDLPFRFVWDCNQKSAINFSSRHEAYTAIEDYVSENGQDFCRVVARK